MFNLKSLFKKLNISDKDSDSVNNKPKNCSYCNKPFTEELWCKECDPFKMIEGRTSENNDIDKFIKDKFGELVPFDRFNDIKQIGEGGFAKVYSATWIDVSMKVALKRLNGSQNM